MGGGVVFILLLSVAVAFSLVACSDGGGSGSDDSSNTIVLSDLKFVKDSDLSSAGITFTSSVNIPYTDSFASLSDNMQNLAVSTDYTVLCVCSMTDSSKNIAKVYLKRIKDGVLLNEGETDIYGFWKNTGADKYIVMLAGFRHSEHTYSKDWYFVDDSGNKSNTLSCSYVIK